MLACLRFLGARLRGILEHDALEQLYNLENMMGYQRFVRVTT